METRSILLVGVGGQGIILTSKLLSTALVEAGFDVKMSEVHGMAQRGGSVTTQVRFGDKVYSPIIGRGQADILVSFELMEAMRWIEYLKPGGKCLVSNYRIPSAPILTGSVPYPGEIAEELADYSTALIVDVAAIATNLGNIRVQNIVMLGCLTEVLDLPEINWEDLIKRMVKPSFQEINILAFGKGKEFIKNI